MKKSAGFFLISKKREICGFTLIEILIVVAIIGLLASISVPAYYSYAVKSANSACLAELKSYIQVSLALIQDGKTPESPATNRCESISKINRDTLIVVGVSRQPGNIKYSVDMSNGGLISEEKK